MICSYELLNNIQVSVRFDQFLKTIEYDSKNFPVFLAIKLKTGTF